MKKTWVIVVFVILFSSTISNSFAQSEDLQSLANSEHSGKVSVVEFRSGTGEVCKTIVKDVDALPVNEWQYVQCSASKFIRYKKIVNERIDYAIYAEVTGCTYVSTYDLQKRGQYLMGSITSHVPDETPYNLQLLSATQLNRKNYKFHQQYFKDGEKLCDVYPTTNFGAKNETLMLMGCEPKNGYEIVFSLKKASKKHFVQKSFLYEVLGTDKFPIIDMTGN